MKRLVSNISSQWIEAANRLKPRKAARRIIAYVESYDDIGFWRSILDEFESPRIRFEIMLPSNTSLMKGKKSAMMHQLGPYMIACVDADYDWLMQGQTPISKQLCQSPYVLHTYVYSIENFQCYAPGLHQACTRATLNDREILNLQAWVEEYSRIIWPLFVWNIWMYRMGLDNEFGIMQLADTIKVHEINPQNPMAALDYIRHRVNKRMNRLQQHYTAAKKTLNPLREELLGMGLTPEETYLYIQGHSLKDGVILPLLIPICNQLRREREREINTMAIHEQQRSNELSNYQHSSMPIEETLNKSTAFRRSQQYQLLKADIKRLIGDVGAEK